MFIIGKRKFNSDILSPIKSESPSKEKEIFGELSNSSVSLGNSEDSMTVSQDSTKNKYQTIKNIFDINSLLIKFMPVRRNKQQNPIITTHRTKLLHTK